MPSLAKPHYLLRTICTCIRPPADQRVVLDQPEPQPGACRVQAIQHIGQKQRDAKKHRCCSRRFFVRAPELQSFPLAMDESTSSSKRVCCCASKAPLRGDYIFPSRTCEANLGGAAWSASEFAPAGPLREQSRCRPKAQLRAIDSKSPHWLKSRAANTLRSARDGAGPIQRPSRQWHFPSRHARHTNPDTTALRQRQWDEQQQSDGPAQSHEQCLQRASRRCPGTKRQPAASTAWRRSPRQLWQSGPVCVVQRSFELRIALQGQRRPQLSRQYCALPSGWTARAAASPASIQRGRRRRR